MVLPPGHPPIGSRLPTTDGADVDEDEDDDRGEDDGSGDGDRGAAPGPRGATGAAQTEMKLPPGHPPTGGRTSADALPMPTENFASEDGSLPPGTVAVEVRDGLDRPVPRVRVVLNVLVQTIAKTDDRKQLTATTDDSGEARFQGLAAGATASYGATVPWPAPNGDTANYSSPPFDLDLAKGERVRVHVFPASHNINDTLVGMHGMVYIELHDDALQIYEMFRVFNMGSKSWVPSDVFLDLPPRAKAFHSESADNDARFELESVVVLGSPPRDVLAGPP